MTVQRVGGGQAPGGGGYPERITGQTGQILERCSALPVNQEIGVESLAVSKNTEQNCRAE